MAAQAAIEMTLIIDTSVAIAWCARSQSTAMTQAAEEFVVDYGGMAPAHFQLELVHSLHRLERSRRLQAQVLDAFLFGFPTYALQYDLVAVDHVASLVLPLARQWGLGLYDAAYLELALRLQLPIATRDKQLAAATIAAGGTLFAP